MIDFYSKLRYDFDDLCQLVKVLRAPDGCPWDSVQTHQSIRRNFLEEAYEACEAIDQQDPVHLREELGDVLLHVVFHASIEADAGRFTIDDVCDTVVKKMISRHPARPVSTGMKSSAGKRAKPHLPRSLTAWPGVCLPFGGRKSSRKKPKKPM